MENYVAVSATTTSLDVIEIDLADQTSPREAVFVPERFGTLDRRPGHLHIDRSQIPLGDLFVLTEGTRVRLSTRPDALAPASLPVEHLVQRVFLAALGVRGEVQRTLHERLHRIPALSVADVSPELTRCRCSPTALPQPRTLRGREAAAAPGRLARLVQDTVVNPASSAVACSGGISSSWLRSCISAVRGVDTITVEHAETMPGTDRGAVWPPVASRCDPLLEVLDRAAAAETLTLISALGLRPLFARRITDVARPDAHARPESARPESAAEDEAVVTSGGGSSVPWLTTTGSTLVHEALDAAQHSWDTWLDGLDQDRARIAWSWTDPVVTSVLSHAAKHALAHRSPVEMPEFVELALALPASARVGFRHGMPMNLPMLRPPGLEQVLISSGEQRLRRQSVDLIDAVAAQPAAPQPVWLAEAGLLDPTAFAAALAHPFLRAQHALALRRTLEAEQWLSTWLSTTV